jgi:hypothetical protein
MKDADGKTEWQYAYRGSQAVDFVNFNGPSAYDTLIMVANSGKGQGVVIIDPQGRVRKTVNAQLNTSYGPHITKAEADAQGGIYIMQWTEQALNLQPYFAYSTNFIKVDTSLNKYWGFVYGDYYRGYFRDIALSKTDFAGIGNDFQKVVSGIYASRDMRVAKINQATSSIDNYCNYVSDLILPGA